MKPHYKLTLSGERVLVGYRVPRDATGLLGWFAGRVIWRTV